MSNFVLAIVGLAGTGKSEVARFISTTYSFAPIYFGGYILDELRQRQLDITSQNEKTVREDLRSKRGMHVIAELSYPDIQKALDKGSNVVIDGLYSSSEYEYLKDRVGKDFFLLAVHSPKRLRYERVANRKDRSLSPLEVDSRDYFELKNLAKCEPIVLADFHIVNDGSVDELVGRLNALILGLIERS